MPETAEKVNKFATYWDHKLETQSRQAWDELKLTLLKKHLKHAYNASPYYRQSFDKAGVHPDKVKKLSDIEHFPFINKAVLRDRQQAVPPFGDLVAVPEEEIVYICTSSGSTGIQTASPFTAKDFEAWMDYEARQFWSSGLRPTDRYCHALSMSLFVGGPCVLGAQKLGALTIHAGTLPSERLISMIQQFGATAIWTTPSYAWYLGETAVKAGIDPRKDFSIRKIFVAGEPGGSIPETRQRIEDLWGADVYDYYGLSDIFGSCAGMCEEKDGLHWAEDHILIEVINPDTGETVPEGERGEMVLTTLQKTARPLIRFRTGDIVSYTKQPCRCGRTSLRLHGIHGRLDDMLIIKGINVFPSDIEAFVRKDPDFTGEYRLIVTKVNLLDDLTVQAEKNDASQASGEALAARLRAKIKSVLGVSANVEVLPEGTIPRATHKAKRVIDNRSGFWGGN